MGVRCRAASLSVMIVIAHIDSKLITNRESHPYRKFRLRICKLNMNPWCDAGQRPIARLIGEPCRETESDARHGCEVERRLRLQCVDGTKLLPVQRAGDLRSPNGRHGVVLKQNKIIAMMSGRISAHQKTGDEGRQNQPFHDLRRDDSLRCQASRHRKESHWVEVQDRRRRAKRPRPANARKVTRLGSGTGEVLKLAL